MEVLLSTIAGYRSEWSRNKRSHSTPGGFGRADTVRRRGRGGRRGCRAAPSVSVNASPPEWPINSNYGKEATITRLRGSILNPRTLYSRASLPLSLPFPAPRTGPGRPREVRGWWWKSLTLVAATARARSALLHEQPPPAIHAVPLSRKARYFTAARCYLLLGFQKSRFIEGRKRNARRCRFSLYLHPCLSDRSHELLVRSRHHLHHSSRIICCTTASWDAEARAR